MTQYLLTRRLIAAIAVTVGGFVALVAIAMELVGKAPPGKDFLTYTAGWLIIPYCFGLTVGLTSLIVFKTGKRAVCVFGLCTGVLLVILLFVGVAPSKLPTIADTGNASGILAAAVTIMLFVPAVSATIASIAAALWQSLKSKLGTCSACGCDLSETTEVFCPDCGAVLAMK
jgi:hypothetical protein